MATITLQKQISGTTTKSVLTVTEDKRTSEKTTFNLNAKTNLVSSSGWVGTSISLYGVVQISGAGMTTQSKTLTLKKSSESWGNTNVHTTTASFEVTIPANVTNITITYTCYYSDATNDRMSGTTSMSLTKLISILNAFENNTSLNIEQPLILSITKYDSTHINNLNLKLANNIIATWNSVENNDEITLTEEQLNNFFSLSSTEPKANLSWVLDTYKDDVKLGEMTLQSIAIIQDANPIFTTFDYVDSNSITNNLTGNNQIIILGKSTLKTTISIANRAVAQKGATIISYMIDEIEKPYSDTEDVSIEIPNYNKTTITVSAIDSRGNSTNISINLENTINYSDITAISGNIERKNSTGTQVDVDFRGNYWNGNFGVDENTLKATYKYKTTNSSEWTELDFTETITTNENNYSYSGALKGDSEDNGFEIDNSYDIEITVSDGLSSVVFKYQLIAGSPAIKIKGNKVLEINGLEEILQTFVDFFHPIGSLYITTEDTNPSNIFGGKWEQITDDAYLKIVSSNGGFLGGTSADHKIPLTSIPNHSHTFGTWYDGASGSAQTVEGWGTKKQEKTHSTSKVGGGQAYYPYYLGVYVWKRVE